MRAGAAKISRIIGRESRWISQLGRGAAKRTRIAIDAVTRPSPIANSVLLIGYIDAQLGLGQSLRGLALALSRTAINFRIYPFRVGVEDRPAGSYMPERYDTARAHAINIIEVSPDELPNVFSHIREYYFDRSHNILRTYWELGHAPAIWRQNISVFDEIWAPSEFVAKSFSSIFDRTITIVPPSLEIASLKRNNIKRFNIDKNSFYFLFSFDYHSLPYRKNPQALLQAFRLAFPDPSTQAGLIIKSTGAVNDYPELRRALLRAAEEDSRIRVIDETISREEMLALIKAADCYVSLHRAEGFGLGMVEAMAFGKPVIATDYSGSTDFLSEATGYPVPYQLTKVGADEYVHAEGQVWAEPSVSDCARIMSHVFHNREEAAARARQAQLLVNERYSPTNVGRLAEKRLNEIFALQAKGAGTDKPEAR